MIEPVTPTADKKIARYVCYFSYVVVIFVHSCNLTWYRVILLYKKFLKWGNRTSLKKQRNHLKMSTLPSKYTNFLILKKKKTETSVKGTKNSFFTWSSFPAFSYKLQPSNVRFQWLKWKKKRKEIHYICLFKNSPVSNYSHLPQHVSHLSIRSHYCYYLLYFM